MAFTYNLASSDETVRLISQVRLELGDNILSSGVLPSGANLQDEEISHYLTINDNDVAATVTALAGVLHRHWASAVDVQVGQRRESLSQAAARWEKIAAGGQGAAGSSFVTHLGRVDGYAEAAGGY